jgi:hypothetical protein
LGFKQDVDELVGNELYGWRLAPGHEQPMYTEDGKKKLPRQLVPDETEQRGLAFMRSSRERGEEI